MYEQPSPVVALVVAPRMDGTWPDEETPLLLAEFQRRGISSAATAWYEPHDWAAYSAVIIRTPDTYWHADEFFRWLTHLEEVDAQVVNSASVVRWGFDKHYLQEFAEAGIPIIPTAFVEVGEVADLPEVEFVVKPVTSAGALHTARYRPHEQEQAARHIAEMHEQGLAVIVQPYLPTLDIPATRERSLVFFQGEFSHAVRKNGLLRLDEPHSLIRESFPEVEACRVSPAEQALALRTLQAIPGENPLLQARVDIATDNDGCLVVMEVEVSDPWLFLAQEPDAAARFASAVETRLRSK